MSLSTSLLPPQLLEYTTCARTVYLQAMSYSTSNVGLFVVTVLFCTSIQKTHANSWQRFTSFCYTSQSILRSRKVCVFTTLRLPKCIILLVSKTDAITLRSLSDLLIAFAVCKDVVPTLLWQGSWSAWVKLELLTFLCDADIGFWRFLCQIREKENSQ